jgi:ABC-type nitrate/sulfonate/bicarbonate transport system permease component
VRKLGQRWMGLLLIVGILVVWEVASASGMIRALSFPRVSAIGLAWVELAAEGDLFVEMLDTLRRMFIGFAVAALIGVPLGLLMGASRFAHSLFEPLTELLRPIPSPAYIPIAILLLGIGDNMKVAVVSIAAVFPILLNTYQGVRDIDPVVTDTGRTLGLGKSAILREVALPAAMPSVLTGMRISLGIAFIVVVVAEMIIGNDGIGHLILDSQRTFQIPEMYAGIFTLAVVGYAINWFFVKLEQVMLRGRPRRAAL